jgi:hypothetical protein
LYNILAEFGVPVKLVRLINMYLYVVDGEIHIGKNLSDAFPVQNGVKQGDALLPLLFNFRICHQEGARND